MSAADQWRSTQRGLARCLLLLALSSSGVASALTPDVVDRLKRGTVLIRTTTGEGSGFFFADGVILTNRHVVDDVTGMLFAVESDSRDLFAWADDPGWMRFGAGENRQVAASGGTVWTLKEDGSVYRWNESGWRDLELTGTEEVVACAGIALLRAGSSIWIHDGERLTNDGKPVVSGVQQVSCQKERIYGLMSDGTIHDLVSGAVLDTNTDNKAIYATTDGLLALTVSANLWFFDESTLSWARVASPETEAPQSRDVGLPSRLAGSWGFVQDDEIERAVAIARLGLSDPPVTVDELIAAGFDADTILEIRRIALQARLGGEVGTYRDLLAVFDESGVEFTSTRVELRLGNEVESGRFRVLDESSAQVTLWIEWDDGTHGRLVIRFSGADEIVIVEESGDSLTLRRKQRDGR